MPEHDDVGHEVRDGGRGVEFAGLLPGFGGELAEHVLVGVPEGVGGVVEEVDLVELRHELGDDLVLRGLGVAELLRVEVDVVEDVGEVLAEPLDLVEGLGEGAELELVALDVAHQALEGELGVEDEPGVGLELLDEVRVGVVLLVSPLALGDGELRVALVSCLRLGGVEQLVGEVFVEEEPEDVVLVLVGVHLPSQDVRASPEYGF